MNGLHFRQIEEMWKVFSNWGNRDVAGASLDNWLVAMELAPIPPASDGYSIQVTWLAITCHSESSEESPVDRWLDSYVILQPKDC